MGLEAEKYEIAAKKFENTFRAMGFRDFRILRPTITGGAFKAPYTVTSEPLWGGAAQLDNPDALFYAESHG